MASPCTALEIIPAPESAALAVCGRVPKRYGRNLGSARSRNTVRGYRSAFGQFEKWCRQAGRDPLPATPEVIAMYIGGQAGRLRPATLAHHLAAISKTHKWAGLASPVRDNELIAETMKGVRSVHGSAVKQKRPVLTDDLRLMLRYTPKDIIGIRDRALLLCGFAGAFRRSELVGLDVEDLAFTTEGLAITLRRSKTDQEGQGRVVALPFGKHQETCPVLAMRTWLDAAGITTGAVFCPFFHGGRIRPERLSDHAVAGIVKRYCVRAGLDANLFSGHSLRAGFVTSAARVGEPERRIMRQTGHKSIEMVLRYVRNANQFTDNAALALWL